MMVRIADLLRRDGRKTTDILLVNGGNLDPAYVAAAAAAERPTVEYLQLERDYGIPVLSFDLLTETTGAVPWIRRFAGSYWALAYLLRFGIDDSHPIVATGEDIGFPLALLNGWTGAGKRTVAMITHGSFLGSPKAAMAFRVLRRFPGVQFLCLSESLRQRIVEQHHIPSGRVCNVGYGVDTRFFTPRFSDAEPPKQIMSAGMAMRDYRTLAAAAGGLPDIEVRIAADSAWFRSDLDIDTSSLPPNVSARSYGDYLQLRELYAASAFAVVPLYPAVHACGYAVIIEAMAMGKPVITTRIEGRSDFIIEGETGFYVSPEDPEELRERIRYLMDRPALIREMGARARQLIEAKYSVEDFAARIAAVVQAQCVEKKALASG